MTPLCRLRKLFCLRGIGALVLGGIFLGILGCAPTASRGVAPPESGPPGGWTPEELLKNLAQRLQDFRSLRTLATVYYSGTDGRGGFQEVVLIHRPDRLRLETLSLIGAILIVTANRGEVVGFHPREGLFYRGRSSKENLLRYTRIPLGLGDLTSLLMGLPPVESQGHWESKGLAIYLEKVGGEKEMVAFDPSLGIPIKWARLGPDGGPELSADFSDFFSSPAGPFPLKISLEAHAQQMHLEITYQEPELNIDLLSSLFDQKKPENVREIPLESLGG